MKAYSREFRRDVLAACDAGEGTQAVALRFKCSESWVRRVKQERREQGKVAPCTNRRRKSRWLAEADRIQECLRRRPDLTLHELKQELGTTLSVYTLCRALKRLRMTLKKSTKGVRAGSSRRRRTTC